MRLKAAPRALSRSAGSVVRCPWQAFVPLRKASRRVSTRQTRVSAPRASTCIKGGLGLLPADATLAAADEAHQVQRFGSRDLCLDLRQGVLQFQTGAIENLVGL